jgi:hypothetical protein
MSTPIKRLARLADALQGRTPRNGADDVWLGAALDQYLGGQDLDVALDVAARPGLRDCRTDLKLQLRDGLLRQLAHELLPDNNPSEQAHALHCALDRYYHGGFQNDRLRSPPPADQLESKLWKILLLHPAPLSERRLRYVLGRELSC